MANANIKAQINNIRAARNAAYDHLAAFGQQKGGQRYMEALRNWQSLNNQLDELVAANR